MWQLLALHTSLLMDQYRDVFLIWDYSWPLLTYIQMKLGEYHKFVIEQFCSFTIQIYAGLIEDQSMLFINNFLIVYTNNHVSPFIDACCCSN